MKVIDIAIKDMLRYFRSAFAVGMMLVIPLLVTGLIYFAFGGVLTSSETEAYTLPVIQVQIANLDEGDAASGANFGQTLIDALTSDAVKDVFAVTLAPDEAAARGAVDQQQAAVALIVPPNFTRAALASGQQAELVLYQDPALSFGPGITREITSQFLDALSGSQIALRAASAQLAEKGIAVDAAAAAQVQADYTAFFVDMAAAKGWNLPVTKRLPNKETPKSVGDHRTTLLGPVMAGMMIFFVFFTGTNTAQSILKEQEEGTLARLFTTPTSIPVILGGKYAAIFITLIVQSIVLTIASALVFGIEWGNLFALGLVMVGLVVSGAGFGVLLMSLVKNTRQAGPLTGGVLALMGMVSGLFTTGLPSGPALLEQVGVITPQNWALRGMKLVLAGAAPQDVLLPLLVMLAFGLLFFFAGARTFRRRFA